MLNTLQAKSKSANKTWTKMLGWSFKFEKYFSEFVSYSASQI